MTNSFSLTAQNAQSGALLSAQLATPPTHAKLDEQSRTRGAQLHPVADRPRRLLLCLDGVPHAVIEAARARGMFNRFNEPAKLLSPFPTMTNIALSTMLSASAPLGYESLYFDHNQRRLCGGISKYIGPRTPDKIPSSYMDTLDYQEPLACEFLVYVAPDRICQADFNRFNHRFNAASPNEDYFAFLKATDGLLHICGAERLQENLVALDRILNDIMQRGGAETEIVLFSDHGMNLVENKRVRLRKHLERHGYTWAGNLRNAPKRGIAVPAFGLCGYIALYCANEAEAASVAEVLAELEGVDFSLTRDNQAVLVTNNRGTARIHRRAATNGTPSYRYERRTGDPLGLAAVLSELEAKAELDVEGYATEEVWFEATKEHRYPNALPNLYGAIQTNRVRHTADVLVSLDDGYYYGATAFSYIARRLLATHGNALQASSHAFLMSTHRTFPAHVRAEEAEPLLR